MGRLPDRSPGFGGIGVENENGENAATLPLIFSSSKTLRKAVGSNTLNHPTDPARDWHVMPSTLTNLSALGEQLDAAAKQAKEHPF